MLMLAMMLGDWLRDVTPKSATRDEDKFEG